MIKKEIKIQKKGIYCKIILIRSISNKNFEENNSLFSKLIWQLEIEIIIISSHERKQTIMDLIKRCFFFS